MLDGRVRATAARYRTVVRSRGAERLLLPGCFTRSLRSQLPELRWSHDRSHVWGQVTGFEDGPDRLVVVGRAYDTHLGHQALRSLATGTAFGASIGYTVLRSFARDGIEVVTEARLDEVSLTPAPADRRCVFDGLGRAA